MRRRVLLTLCVAFTAAAPIAAAVLLADSRVTPLRWDQASQGLPVLVVGSQDVWIDAIKVFPTHSVYRVDPARATVRPTPLSHSFLDLFPGNGTLWGSSIATGTNRQRLYWIDMKHGYRLVEKDVPATCGLSDGGHSVVYRERLWYTCKNSGAYVYTTTRRQWVQVVRLGILALLSASNGLWAESGQSLRAIAGPSHDAVIRFPRGFFVTGDYASNVGWAVEGTTAWAIGNGNRGNELVRFDLKRRVASAFSIVTPGLGPDDFPGFGVAIAGNEVWIADSKHVRLIRYSAKHPRKPLGYILLPARQPSKDIAVEVASGAGAAWADVQDRDGVDLYRVSIKP